MRGKENGLFSNLLNKKNTQAEFHNAWVLK